MKKKKPEIKTETAVSGPHWIWSSTYNYPVLIFVGPWDKYRKYMKRRYKSDVGPQTAVAKHDPWENDNVKGIYFSAVWIQEFIEGDPRDISVLVHELYHAAHSILNTVHVRHGYRNQEPFAYVLDHLVMDALYKLKPRKIRSKK